MAQYEINLERIANHKLIYEEGISDNCEKGMDGIFVLESSSPLHDDEEILGINFHFITKQNDNVVCELQRLFLSIEADTLHVAGFAYWGDTNETFLVRYEDGAEEYVQVPFFDWSREIVRTMHSISWFGDRNATIKRFLTSGRLSQVGYIHSASVDLKHRGIIKEIVLPDNMFIHVFAITLESNKAQKEEK